MKFKLPLFTIAIIYIILVAASPTAIYDDSNDNGLPLLKLPYGTWRAAKYDEGADIYTFRNIRFAEPPIGELRWARPVPPHPVHGIQDGSYGPHCLCEPTPPQWQGPLFGNLSENASEDCLFLDIYVPGKAIMCEHQKPLPVVVWIYGGGYSIGAKDQSLKYGIYDGTSLIEQSRGNVIIVTFNYRLGAFGWLAGTSVEEEGVPNAGLHDQRAALQWVQDHIALVGGDPDNVSAWGESAGAGSIFLHLVANGGTLDPLFHRAIAMSPAVYPQMDRRGSIEDEFQEFATYVGCAGKGLSCLRALNASTLQEANINLQLGQPAPDGEYIRREPTVEVLTGNYWKGLESLIVSHVADEGLLFVPDPLPDDYVQGYLEQVFPAYVSNVVIKLNETYTSKYAHLTPLEMASVVVRDAVFTCNVRSMVEAYAEKTHLMQYFVGNATHGSDVAAMFYSSLVYNQSSTLFSDYQSYMISHAITGDPNTLRATDGTPSTIYWPLVSGVNAESLRNGLNVTDDGFELISDAQVLKSVCSVWQQGLLEATLKGGY